MKVLPRTEFGNPILRATARTVPRTYLKTPAFKTLREQMIHTMRRANGVGLAAPQIGVPLRIAVMEIRKTPTRPSVLPQGPITIVNPVIKKYSTHKKADWEGCLSLHGVRGKVPRSDAVTVTYTDESGHTVTEHATGLWARIFQHEIDHLNGTVYVDRMPDMRTLMTTGEFKKRVLKQQGR